MDLLTRLNDFMQKQRMSSSQFADAIGIPRPSMSQILNGRNKKISNEFIEKLHHAFPALDMMWLLFGEVTPSLNATLSDNKRKSEPSLFDTADTDDTADIDAADDVEDNQFNPENITYNDSDKNAVDNTTNATEDFKDDNSQNETPTPTKPSIGIRPVSSTTTDIADNNDNTLSKDAQESSTNNNSHSDGMPSSVIKIVSKRSIDTIIVFYDDNTYQRFKPE